MDSQLFGYLFFIFKKWIQYIGLLLRNIAFGQSHKRENGMSGVSHLSPLGYDVLMWDETVRVDSHLLWLSFLLSETHYKKCLKWKEVTCMKNFNKKKLILPVLLAVISYVAVPFMSSEIDAYGAFFVVAVGIGLGFMINQFIFKKAWYVNRNEKVWIVITRESVQSLSLVIFIWRYSGIMRRKPLACAAVIYIFISLIIHRKKCKTYH